MSNLIQISRWFGKLFNGRGAREADSSRAVSADARETNYEVNSAFYEGTIYDAWLPSILPTVIDGTIDNKAFAIRGWFNPTKAIVDTYQNCIPGTWGDGVEIDPMVDQKPVNPKLAEPVRKIWRDSNLDTKKEVIQRYAANLGTVGLRPTRIAGTDKVLLQVDHPSRIFLQEKDGEGNITAVVLKWKERRNFGSRIDPDFQTVEIVMEITKDDFSYTIDGKQQIIDTGRRNHYGFCPYVTLIHCDNETDFGNWAYKGSESIIHAINWRTTQQDTSIGRHMFPKWLLAATGNKPEQIDMGSEKATYIKLSPDGPDPFMQAIVPQLDQMSAMEFTTRGKDELRRRHPEMALNDLTLIAGTSGETLAQVLKQVEAAVKLRRPAYDHAFIRAIQMCLSMGMVDRIPGFDIGAGLGEGSGDRAYRTGLEAFQFAPRPALPLTPVQQQQIAVGANADRSARFDLAAKAQKLGVSEDEAFRIAGFTEDQIKTIRQERSTKDVVPTQSL